MENDCRRGARQAGSACLTAALAATLAILPAGPAPEARAAETVMFRIDPGSQSATAGDQVNLAVQVSTGSQQVDGVQFTLRFPPALLEVIDAGAAAEGVQVRAGTALPTTLLNVVDVHAGTVEFAAGRALSGGSSPAGTFVAASLQFRSRAEGTASIEFLDGKATFGGAALPGRFQDGVVVLAGAGEPLPPAPPGPQPATRPAPPTVAGPAGAVVASDLAPLLRWRHESGVTQFHLQVIPYNLDGPGIDLVIGDGAQVSAARYQVHAPSMSARAGFVLLPGMSYRWRVRVSSSAQALDQTSSQWSAWAQGDFRTPAPSSATVRASAPAPGSTVEGLTPRLTWSNADDRVFYYEVQLSRDHTFNTDPATATAMVYWELVHGGVSDPHNTYAVPQAFPLESAAQYFWRVRPRVQGDGVPVPWSQVWSFSTP